MFGSLLRRRSGKSLPDLARSLNISPEHSGLDRVINIVDENAKRSYEEPRIKISSIRGKRFSDPFRIILPYDRSQPAYIPSEDIQKAERSGLRGKDRMTYLQFAEENRDIITNYNTSGSKMKKNDILEGLIAPTYKTKIAGGSKPKFTRRKPSTKRKKRSIKRLSAKKIS